MAWVGGKGSTFTKLTMWAGFSYATRVPTSVKWCFVGGTDVVWAGGITKQCVMILATLYMCGCGFGLAVGG